MYRDKIKTEGKFEMENTKLTNTPYDDVFRTLLNDCSLLIFPVLNEVFGEHYTGEEDIIFSPNEHFLNRQGGEEDERITDSSFQVQGEVTKKYHLECQSSSDSSLLVRIFEYDTQIALDDGELRGNTLTVTLPHSAVLFLRCRATTPETLKIRIETPGGAVEYEVLTIKTQRYSLEEIFEKKLLLLIPFYIFSHEGRFMEYEKDGEKLRGLQEEYAQIKSRLEELAESGMISEYVKCTIIDMSNKVLEHIANRYQAVREGVKSVMGGRVLEYEAKTIKREGIAEGRERGIAEGRERGIAEGRERGMAEGREKGIRDTVSILKNLGIQQQTILAQIQEKYNLSSESAKKYLSI